MQPPQLPPCPINQVREYLGSRGMIKLESECTPTREMWISADGMELVRFPCENDHVAFMDVVGLMEIHLRLPVFTLPFYRPYLEYWRPDGTAG